MKQQINVILSVDSSIESQDIVSKINKALSGIGEVVECLEESSIYGN